MKPYVLHAGEGRTYLWHGVHMEVKAGRAELDGRMSVVESLTRKGEEPHMHVHDEEEELFYVLAGKLTFHADGVSTDVEDGAFVFVPKNTPHTYAIRSEGDVRLLVINIPGVLGDTIERDGDPVK